MILKLTWRKQPDSNFIQLEVKNWELIYISTYNKQFISQALLIKTKSVMLVIFNKNI